MSNDSNVKHSFAYKDLREWIREADKLGEMKYINGLTWEREIGMVTEMLHHTDPAPCGLFDEVPGIKKGFRVLTNFFSAKRANMTLGFPAGLNRLELSEEFLKVYRNPNNKPIPHKIVETDHQSDHRLRAGRRLRRLRTLAGAPLRQPYSGQPHHHAAEHARCRQHEGGQLHLRGGAQGRFGDRYVRVLDRVRADVRRRGRAVRHRQVHLDR